MIETITANASFKTSDVTIAVDFQPKPGITAVVGQNGSGKTFTAQESLRYLLFGTKALRAPLSTYETLEVDGTVHIHGQPYHVERGLNGATLSHEGQVLAKGQEEVTNKIASLLGYGREVFDLCNASVQGQTQSLGELRPAQRKEMIDRVLRVTDVRVTEKALREEATALKREASALADARPSVPAHPQEPEDYENSQFVNDKLEAARRLRDERRALSSQIKTVQMPETPSRPRVSEDDIAKLVEKEALLALAATSLPDKIMTEEQIEIAQARHAWEVEKASRGPEPSVSKERLDRDAQRHAEHDAVKGMPDVETECPECGHEFNTRPPLPDVSDALHPVDIIAERRRHEAWSTPLPPEPSDEHGVADDNSARRMRAAAKQAEEIRKAQEELDNTDWPDTTLEEARRINSDWDAYDRLLEHAQKVDIDNAVIQRQLDDMDEEPDIDALVERYHEMRNYEADVLRYQQAWDKVVELDEKIVAKQRLAEEYTEGVKELGEARAELKSLLAPLLTREASALIHDMTNGKLKDLTVDEDMNIVVAGQPLETLSGAGKTVANIALRVALAKTLTGSAFPVFIGDEMDGDLDHERREATTQAMLSLKNHLTQIILITHKDVDIADHVVDLGETV